MREWDVNAYERFERERLQPSIDLANRIMISNPKRILDIGCGSGMSTKVLVNRWPKAEVIGLDNSNTMLKKAQELDINVKWTMKDCNESLEEFEKVDVIFSNASIQWLNDQEKVIENWFKALNSGGMIAVQIPLFEQMYMNECIVAASKMERWQPYFKEIESKTYHSFSEDWYYNVVSKYSDDIEMWETDYYHILDNHKAIIEFCKSTALRAYLSALNDVALEEAFINDVLKNTKQYYKVQKDGKVFYKFKRLFIVAVAR